MKPSEVAELLILDAGLNRYASAGNQSKEKAVAWAAALNVRAAGMSFGEAQELLVEHYAGSDESLTPFALIELWERRHRRLPHQVASDVRSAKARGLVDRTWSERDPLPVDVAGRLAQARQAARVAASEEIEGGKSPLELEVGRRL